MTSKKQQECDLNDTIMSLINNNINKLAIITHSYTNIMRANLQY